MKDRDRFIGSEADFYKKLNENLFTVEEVSKKLGVTERAVRLRLQKGSYESYKGLIYWPSVLEYQANKSKGGKPTHKKPPYIV